MDGSAKSLIPPPGLLLNPRLAKVEREGFARLEGRLKSFEDHYWIASSGSTSVHAAKVIGLSKDALRASAAAVNRRLGATVGDVWGLSLPTFHVGGLGILIRASLSDSRVADLRPLTEGQGFRDIAEDFVARLHRERVTLLSLVPTQVFDLVDLELAAPPNLRAVIVGGASLAPELYHRGVALGWPLYPSFGMTECGSQIATARRIGTGDAIPPLEILDHCECRNWSAEGLDDLLAIKSAALLTGQYRLDDQGDWTFEDPKIDGELRTQDRVELFAAGPGGPSQFLRPLGRSTDFVKIKGEGVDLARLRESFFADWKDDERERAVLIDVPDVRDGAAIWLCLENGSVPEILIRQRLQTWNTSAFPTERIREVAHVDRLPRTELGKIAWAKLRESLSGRGPL